jgi:hypothetical protein
MSTWKGRARCAGVSSTGVLPQTGQEKRVSRRVGEFVSEQAWGEGFNWSIRRAERAGPLPPGLLRLGRRRDGTPAPLW